MGIYNQISFTPLSLPSVIIISLSLSSAMAFLLSKTTFLSRLQSQSQLSNENPFPISRRGFHIELGAREKALLEEDPALKKFKSYKRSVWRLKRVGDVLTIIVVAGCCYEIYVRALMKKGAVLEAQANSKQA